MKTMDCIFLDLHYRIIELVSRSYRYKVCFLKEGYINLNKNKLILQMSILRFVMKFVPLLQKQSLHYLYTMDWTEL